MYSLALLALVHVGTSISCALALHSKTLLGHFGVYQAFSVLRLDDSVFQTYRMDEQIQQICL